MPFETARYITAPSANIVYNLDHVVYYEIQNENKVKVRFSNGDNKDLEGADARQFLSAVKREPLAPGQAA